MNQPYNLKLFDGMHYFVLLVYKLLSFPLEKSQGVEVLWKSFSS